MTIRTQTLLMVTVLLAASVLATGGVVGWSSRRALLAETEAQGLVIARLLARSAAFGARVMNDVETAIGEQMVVEQRRPGRIDVRLHRQAGAGQGAARRRYREHQRAEPAHHEEGTSRHRRQTPTIAEWARSGSNR